MKDRSSVRESAVTSPHHAWNEKLSTELWCRVMGDSRTQNQAVSVRKFQCVNKLDPETSRVKQGLKGAQLWIVRALHAAVKTF